MPGDRTTWLSPQTAIAANQSVMTGPNIRPTRAVPQRCEANSVTRIAIAPGTTRSFSPGSTISRPSIEESTEIAGVIMLSPKKSAAPKMPSVKKSFSHRREKVCR